MEPNEYIAELKSALTEYRFRDVHDLTSNIDPLTFNLGQIKKALGLIRRKRLFAELERVAGLFIMAGQASPVVRRQWSQALLDQNRVPQALAALRVMSSEFADDAVEGPEIRGLIGRAYKQLYINEGGAENLRSAVSAYLFDWEQHRGDYRWQGINMVALLKRAKQDGTDTGTELNPNQIARSILDDIEERGATGIWDYATAMEACIALGDSASALDWAQKYIQHPDTDAFELGSTLRQLKEVWRLEATSIGNMFLPVLECALLQREGGSLQPMSSSKITNRDGFEAVWGSQGIVYFQWIDTLYDCCKAIARINNLRTGNPEGTGFLVSGASLNSAWGPAPVLVTNSHVISLNPADEAPLVPSDAQFEFTRLENRPKISAGEVLFSSPRTGMDITVLRIDAPVQSQVLQTTAYRPTLDTGANEPQRIYVIGHPKGNELAVSLYDNNLVEYEHQYVRYRSPTEGGNSGSPVFTRQLKVFAVHHRALYERQLNEGILFDELKEKAIGSRTAVAGSTLTSQSG